MNLEKVIGMVRGVLVMLAPGLKNPASTHSVKELRELLKACLMVSLLLVKKFKDGVQFSDFTEFYVTLTTDAAFKKAMHDAYDGYKLVPAEVKDIDAGEALEVAGDVLAYVDDFVLEFKKEEEVTAVLPEPTLAEAPAPAPLEEKAIDIES